MIQKTRHERTFHAGSSWCVEVEELVNFVRVFAARLTQLFDLSHVPQRVQSAAEVRLPSLRLVDAVRIFSYTNVKQSQSRYSTVRCYHEVPV